MFNFLSVDILKIDSRGLFGLFITVCVHTEHITSAFVVRYMRNE